MVVEVEVGRAVEKMENGESELSLWEEEKEIEEKPKPKKSRRKAKEKSEMYREWQSVTFCRK